MPVVCIRQSMVTIMLQVGQRLFKSWVPPPRVRRRVLPPHSMYTRVGVFGPGRSTPFHHCLSAASFQ